MRLVLPEKLHHAYLIRGDREEAASALLERLEADFGFKTRGNPDFWRGDFDTFGVEDGRVVRERSLTRPHGDKKIFLLCLNFITREAQNSLLKVFEEPNLGTHFFIITASSEHLLPTFKSRLAIVDHGERRSAELSQSFLAAGKAERIVLIKKLAQEISDDKKSRQDALLLLNGVAAALRKRAERDARVAGALFETQKCISYLYDQSASVKMLLEHVALLTPVIR